MVSEEERRKREGSFLLGSNRWERRKKEEKKRGRGEERIFRCFDGRSSTVRELKLVHATGAMRGYQNQCVLSNSKR